MRILMHAVYFPPEVGGLESHIHYLTRALVEAGHRVDVVTSRSQRDLAPQEEIDGVSVWRTWMPARNTIGWATHAMGSLPRFNELAREADVLHAQDIAAVIPCMVAKRRTGTPMVTTYHTSHFLMRAESPLWRPLFRRFLEAGDHNLAASTEIAEVGEAIAPGVSVEPLTNGVETSVFRRVDPLLPPAPEGRRRLVVPRRLFEKNGVEYFVRAMPLITARMDVEAFIVGDGPESDRLQRLARELGVADRIDFLGKRSHDEMPGLLSSAELAVFPSLMEATSVAALESMACELPVAATRVGGLPEIIDDEVGTLYEPSDPGALTDAVVRMLERDDLEALGASARQRVVDRWSNRRLAERHIEIYEGLLREKVAA